MAQQPSAVPEASDETRYGGHTRFELELEVESTLAKNIFVQCLANPMYLNYLATQKMFDNPEFVAFLSYLQYFKEPKYARYLSFPGPTLRALELVQVEQFRKDILIPQTMGMLYEEGMKASTTER